MWLIPSPIRRAFAWVAGAVAFAFIMRGMGKRAERMDAQVKQAERNTQSAMKAKATRHEIETSDDQRLVDILTGLHKPKR